MGVDRTSAQPYTRRERIGGVRVAIDSSLALLRDAKDELSALIDETRDLPAHELPVKEDWARSDLNEACDKLQAAAERLKETTS